MYLKAGKLANAEYISVETISGNIELVNITSKTDFGTRSDNDAVLIQCGNSDSAYAVNIDTETKANITINGQRYNGGYTIGNGGNQTITLKGVNNTFKISNLVLFNNAVVNREKVIIYPLSEHRSIRIV